MIGLHFENLDLLKHGNRVEDNRYMCVHSLEVHFELIANGLLMRSQPSGHLGEDSYLQKEKEQPVQVL